ncbi:MAG TPA: hypothetical protein VFE08_11740 [Candidatus Sulfotelmatobacter sp.]|nr:hypothetical protein [Candidatus Sulfotelmatobacter sp.]
MNRSSRIPAQLRAVFLAAAILTPLIGWAVGGPPEWAYPINPPRPKPALDDGVLRRVHDSDVTYTVTQLRDPFITPVWFPAEHPALPTVVGHGRKPDVYACGYCHLADGSGGPESSTLAGLPKEYIIRQLNDFRSGARRTAVPKRNIDLMIGLTKTLSDEEMASAAIYFSSLVPSRHIAVVETQTAPKTFITGSHLAILEPEEKEPLGLRIVEVPDNLEQMHLGDPHAHYFAYVPPGSLHRGEMLVTTGGEGKTLACTGCHGDDLRGAGPIPRIAGRSCSYIVRQLYDIKHGFRGGALIAPMREVVASLDEGDMIAIAAYLAAQDP